MSNLSYNFDFELLVRADCSSEENDSLTESRYSDIKYRILTNQLVLQLLKATLDKDTTLLRRLVPDLTTLVGKLGANATVDDMSLTESRRRDPYDQQLNCGGSQFELSTWKSFESVLLLVIAAIDSDCDSQLLVDTALNQFTTLRTLLHVEAGDQARYLVSRCDSSSSPAQAFLLNPNWIRRISTFVRTLASWTPILFGFLKTLKKGEIICDGLSMLAASLINISGGFAFSRSFL